MRKPLATLVIERLHYTIPDSTQLLFQDASLHLPLGKVALLGENGSGKSTLLELIAGKISAYEGQLHLPASLLYLEQSLPNLPTAWDVLNLRKEADIIQTCLRGEASIVELGAADALWAKWNDWLELAEGFGFTEESLSNPLNELSPGQRQRLLFLKAMIKEPDVLLIDEPTNHLDREGREQVFAFLRSWKNGLIVATHDRELLEEIEAIVVLEQKRLRLFTGSYKDFEEERRLNQAKRENDFQSADEALRKALSTQRHAMERQQKRSQRTAANSDKLGLPNILIGKRKENAEKTSAKLGEKHSGKVEELRQKRADFRSQIIETASIAMDLPSARAVKGRMLLNCKGLNIRFESKTNLWPKGVDFNVMGGERWQILGGNGSGKSSLLKMIQGEIHPSTGEIIRHAKLKTIYLDQELNLLDSAQTVWANARRIASMQLSDSDLITRLARVGLGGGNRFKSIRTLSGGERMRLALACLFADGNSPDLLILDEPTNHLDLTSVQELELSLKDFKGAILLVSHDNGFAEAIGCENCLKL